MREIKIPELTDIRNEVVKELIKREKLIGKEELKAAIQLEIRKNNEMFNAQIHKLKIEIGRLENK